MRNTTDPLPFAGVEAERLALLKQLSTSYGGAAIDPRRLRGVQTLLETLYLCLSDGERSHARVAVIAAKHIGGVVSERTVRYRLNDAAALGLLVVDQDIRHGGQGPNRYRLDWAAIKTFVAAGHRPDQVAPAAVDQATERLAALDPATGNRAAKIAARPAKIAARAAKIAAPGAAKIAAPDIAFNATYENNNNTAAADLVADLETAGFAGAAVVVDSAARRVGVDQVGALVAHWRQHGGGTPTAAWGIGALRYRLGIASPALAIDAGWPSPSAAWRAATASAKRSTVAASGRDRAVAAAADRAALAGLEAEHGPRLDTLEGPARDDLAAATFGRNAFLFERYRRGGWRSAGVVRETLLAALAAATVEGGL